VVVGELRWGQQLHVEVTLLVALQFTLCLLLHGLEILLVRCKRRVRLVIEVSKAFKIEIKIYFLSIWQLDSLPVRGQTRLLLVLFLRYLDTCNDTVAWLSFKGKLGVWAKLELKRDSQLLLFTRELSSIFISCPTLLLELTIRFVLRFFFGRRVERSILRRLFNLDQRKLLQRSCTLGSLEWHFKSRLVNRFIIWLSAVEELSYKWFSSLFLEINFGIPLHWTGLLHFHSFLLDLLLRLAYLLLVWTQFFGNSINFRIASKQLNRFIRWALEVAG